MSHRVTGRSPAAILHRAQQFVAALQVLLRMGVLNPKSPSTPKMLPPKEAAYSEMMSTTAFEVVYAGVSGAGRVASSAEIGLRHIGHISLTFAANAFRKASALSIVLGAVPMLLLLPHLVPVLPLSVLSWLIALTGFGLLGLLDDFRGEKRIKGLRGHFHAAFTERRITTGFIKAVGGAAIALKLGFLHFPHSPAEALLAGRLIALSANAINLFDLRPGRAGAVFRSLRRRSADISAGSKKILTRSACCASVCPRSWLTLRIAARLAMMGDTGSNPLGSRLGLALVEQPSLPLRIVALALLIALHILAERVSITKLILERFAPLRALDRLTGAR